jgi:hypothetical protein
MRASHLAGKHTFLADLNDVHNLALERALLLNVLRIIVAFEEPSRYPRRDDGQGKKRT